MGNNTPQPRKPRDFDRSFVLIGKCNSGKSTLGNLILEKPTFEVHEHDNAYGVTKKVQSADTMLDSTIVYGQNCPLHEQLKIQILDEPGCNDINFKQENLCEFVKTCIAESKGEMCANFLILINLTSDYLSPEEFFTILNIAEILSKSSYSFFPNAIIVFTHADKIDANLNEEILEQDLREKVGMEEFANINELIKLVEGRYIFIDGTKEANRNNILAKLFQKTRTSLTVYVNGNSGFKGKELKQIFRENPDVHSFRHNLLKYDVEYRFNPDLNLFKRHATMDLGEEITQALDKLSGISKGVSVMILLISLKEIFNQEIYNLILNLPETYKLGEKFQQDFWKYSCIIFKTPVDRKDFILQNIEHNSLLMEIVTKVQDRFSWVTEMTSQKECSERILKLIRNVKCNTEGTTYIDSIVLSEMKRKIQKSIEQRDCEQITTGITNQNFENPIFQDRRTGENIISCNKFFWDESISPQIGYFLLKNINPEVAEQFREKYPDPNGKLSTEEYSEFCLERFRRM